MKFTIALLSTVACFGQSVENRATTGYRDDHALTWIAPSKTRAQIFALTASSHSGERYTATDCATSACAAGGGSIAADFRSDGSAWVMVSGAGGGSQASIWSSGTKVQRSVECASGTTSYTDLAGLSNAPSGEVTIQTGVPGNVRLDQVEISETTQFTGPAGLTGMTVSMGRPGTSNNNEFTGTSMPLQVSSGDANYWSSRPIPPQLSSTYSIVLNFFVPYAYATGTVTTNGTTAVTGSGTNWNTGMTGQWMQIGASWYQFTYGSSTTGTLSSTVSSGSGQAYVLQNFPNQVTAGALTWEVCGYAAR